MTYAYANSGEVSNFRFISNNQEDRIMKDNMTSIIEAAYLTGFEPSADDLTEAALYEEAVEFLTQQQVLTK